MRSRLLHLAARAVLGGLGSPLALAAGQPELVWMDAATDPSPRLAADAASALGSPDDGPHRSPWRLQLGPSWDGLSVAPGQDGPDRALPSTAATLRGVGGEAAWGLTELRWFGGAMAADWNSLWRADDSIGTGLRWSPPETVSGMRLASSDPAGWRWQATLQTHHAPQGQGGAAGVHLHHSLVSGRQQGTFGWQAEAAGSEGVDEQQQRRRGRAFQVSANWSLPQMALRAHLGRTGDGYATLAQLPRPAQHDAALALDWQPLDVAVLAGQWQRSVNAAGAHEQLAWQLSVVPSRRSPSAAGRSAWRPSLWLHHGTQRFAPGADGAGYRARGNQSSLVLQADQGVRSWQLARSLGTQSWPGSGLADWRDRSWTLSTQHALAPDGRSLAGWRGQWGVQLQWARQAGDYVSLRDRRASAQLRAERGQASVGLQVQAGRSHSGMPGWPATSTRSWAWSGSFSLRLRDRLQLQWTVSERRERFDGGRRAYHTGQAGLNLAL